MAWTYFTGVQDNYAATVIAGPTDADHVNVNELQVKAIRMIYHFGEHFTAETKCRMLINHGKFPIVCIDFNSASLSMPDWITCAQNYANRLALAGVTVVEIGNEPTHTGPAPEWASDGTGPYWAKLREAVRIFHQKGIEVSMGCPPLGPDTDFLTAAHLNSVPGQPNIFSLIDGFSLHPYASTPGTNDTTPGTALYWVTQRRNQVDSYGVAAQGVDMWITEFGWGTQSVASQAGQDHLCPGTTTQSREAVQETRLVQSYTNWENHAFTLRLRAACWFWLRDDTGSFSNQPWAYCGLKTDVGQPFNPNPWRWKNGGGQTGNTGIKAALDSFGEGAVSLGPPPDATTDPAIGIGKYQGRLKGRANPNGNASQWQFQYGATTAYGSFTPLTPAGAGFVNAPVDYLLTGLPPNQTYHFRLRVVNSLGQQVFGADRTFTTLVTPLPPEVVTGAATGLTAIKATLNGIVDPNGSDTAAFFEYGATIAYGSRAPADDVAIDAGDPGSTVTTTTYKAVGDGGTTFHPIGTYTAADVGMVRFLVQRFGAAEGETKAAALDAAGIFPLPFLGAAGANYNAFTVPEWELYVQQVVDGVTSGVTHIEVGNECPRAQWTHFFALVKASAPIIRAAGKKIILGAPPPTNDHSVETAFYTAAIAARIFSDGYVDGVATHPYHQDGPAAVKTKVSKVRAKVPAYLPLWITEVGWGVGTPPMPPATTPNYTVPNQATQRDYISQTYALLKAQAFAWKIKAITLFQMKNTNIETNTGATGEAWENRSGVLQFDDTPKASYAPFAAMPTSWVSSTSTPGSITGPTSVSALLSGLTPGVTYHYRLRATNAVGGPIFGIDKTFITSAPAPPEAIAPPVLLPPRLSVQLTTADGRSYFWDGDADDVGNRPLDLAFSSAAGDGWTTMSCVLARPIGFDYPDLALLARGKVLAADGSTVYEGRVAGMPRSVDDDGERIQVQCEGMMASAQDNPFVEIIVDSSTARWTEPSLALRTKIMEDNAPLDADYTVTVGAGIHFKGTTGKTIPANSQSVVEYRAPDGAKIDRMQYKGQERNVTNTETPRFFGRDADDAHLDSWPENIVQNLDGTLRTASFGASRPFGAMRIMRTVAGAPPAANAPPHRRYGQIAVYGDHGITLRGPPADGTSLEAIPQGVYASDVFRYLVRNYCPFLDASEIANTEFVIPHLLFDAPTDPIEAFQRLNAWHGFVLGAWEDGLIQWEPADTSVADWRVRKDEHGIRVDFHGDTVDDFANGMIVVYQDVDDEDHVLWPSDHPALRDDDPDNPANKWGYPKWEKLELSRRTTFDGGIQLGAAALVDFNSPKSSGTITASRGWVRDTQGNPQPSSFVRANQTILVEDLPNDRPRLISATDFSEDGNVTITVERPPSRLDAAVARIELAQQVAGI